MEVSEPPRGDVNRALEEANLSSLADTLSPCQDYQTVSTVIVVKGVIFFTIIVTAILGNALVIASVHRHRRLRGVVYFIF